MGNKFDILYSVKNKAEQFAVAVLVLLSLNGIAQTAQTFTVTGTWTAPNCVTSVDVQVWGAGGGGAGNSTGSDGGGGGTGGGYSAANNVPVTPGMTYTVVVGAGGTAGLMAADATADGGTGGNSWFIDSTTVFAFGGDGGSRPTLGGGAGGAIGLSGVGGFATFNGGQGGQGGNGAAAVGGGGGSSAGTAFAGANGATGDFGGAGGTAPAGGGDGGDGTNSNGSPGLSPGGGGGGSGASGTGGAGADGLVMIDWTDGTETPPSMISDAAVTICTGTTVGLGLVADSPATFVWKASDNPNTTGESTSDQASATITDILVNPTATPQVVTYTVTPTSPGGCEGAPQVVNVTVNPGGIITLTSAVGTDNQIVCQNDSITDITYAITGGATGAVVSVLPAGLNGNYSGGVFTIDGATAVTGVVNYVITTTGATCGNDSIAGTITINPPAAVNRTSLPGTENQTVCEGDNIAPITYTVNGIGDTATVTTLPTGVTGSFSSGTLTIAGAPTTPGSYSYTVTSSGACPSATATGTITVDSNAVLSLVSAPGTDNQTVCEGDSIVDIVYSVSGPGYIVGVAFTSLPAGLTTIQIGNTVTISGATNVTGVHNYTVTSTGGSCFQDTLTGSITVNGTPTIVFNSGNTNQLVCENQPISDISYAISDSVTVTGLPTGVTDTQGGGVVTISGTPTTAGVYTYTVSSSGACPTIDETGTITVDSLPNVTLTSVAGTDAQTVCAGDSITSIVYTETGSSLGVTAAFSSTPAGITVLSSGSSVTISGSTNVIGTHTYTVVTTGGICIQDTLIGSITVTDAPTIVLNTANAVQTVCENQPIFDIVYTVSDSVTVTGLPTGVTGSQSGGTLTISGSPTVAGVYNYTITPISSCPSVTQNGVITVDSLPSISLTSAAGTDAQTVCAGDSITPIVYTEVGSSTGITAAFSSTPLGISVITSGGGSVVTISGATEVIGTHTYTVYTSGGLCAQDTLVGAFTVEPRETIVLNTLNNVQTVCEELPIIDIVYTVSDSATATGLPSGVTGTNSGGQFTISGSPTVTGTYNYTVTTGGSCPAVPAFGTITIATKVQVSLISPPGTDAQSVCEGDSIQPIIYTTDSVTTTLASSLLPLGIQEYNITSSLTFDTLVIFGATSIAGVHTYTVASSGFCPDTAIGSITVNPTSFLPLVSAVGTDSFQTVCEDQPLVPISYIVGDSAVVTPLPSGVTSSISSGIFTISGAPTTAGVYEYTVTTVNNCPPVSAVGSFTVLPNAILTLTSAPGTDSQVVCEGDSIIPITYTVSGGGTGMILTPLLPLGLGSTLIGNTLTISGATNISGTTNYTVAATGVCTRDSLFGSITVNPSTVILLTSFPLTDNQVICETDSILDITYAVGDSAVVTGLPAGVNYSLGGGEARISGTPTVTGSFVYTVTTTSACPSTSTTGRITINPNGILTLSSPVGTDSQIVCVNNPIDTIVYTVSGGGTSMVIVGTLPAGVTSFLNFAGDELTISGTPANGTSGNYTYTVVSTGGGCYQDTLSGSIAVYDGVGIALTSNDTTDDQTVCANTPISTITYTVTGAGTGATVTPLPTGVTGSYSGGLFTISGTPTVAGVYDYTVTTVSKCTNVSATGTITVAPEAEIALTSGSDSVNACVNTAITPIEYTISGGGDSATVTALPDGISGSFSGGVFTISGTPTTVGITNYTVTPTGSCLGAFETGVIVVDEDVVITLTSHDTTDEQTVCVNIPIVDILYSITGGVDDASVAGLPTGVSGSYSSGVFTISGTPSVAGVSNYTIITTGNCKQDTAMGSITVNEDAILTRTSAVGTDSQNVCTNIPLEDITYSVSGGGDSATVTALPTGVTASFVGGVLTISGTPTVAGITDYTVTTIGTCEQQTATGVIEVNTGTGLALSSPSGTDGQTLCANTELDTITYDVTGGGTGATVTPLPAGVTGTYSGGVFTITGTPTVAGTTDYTVTTTGTCAQQSLTGSITVDPAAEIALSSAAGTDSQSVCINTPIDVITYAISGAGTGATVAGLPAGVTGTDGGATFTISGTPTVSGVFEYTVTPTGTCVNEEQIGVIEVSTDVSLALATVGLDTQDICKNVPITTISYSVLGDVDSVRVDGLPGGFTGSLVLDLFSIDGTDSTEGTYDYTVTAYGKCSQSKEYGSITINPDAKITLATVGLDTQSVCINVGITDIVYTLSDGATGANTLLLPAGITASVSGSSYTISGTPTESGAFNYLITTSGGCSQDRAEGLIIINPDVEIALFSASGTDAQSVCESTAITPIRYTTTGIVDSVSVVGLPSGVTSDFNLGIVSIVGSPTVVGAYTYTVTTFGDCVQADTTGTITVNPNADIALTSASGTDAQNVCLTTSMTPITYTVTGGGTGATVTGLPSGATGSYSSGSVTISGTPTQLGTFTYTVVTSGTCKQDTAIGTIVVEETTLALASALETTNQVLCSNNLIEDISFAFGGTATGATVLSPPADLTTSSSGGVFTISGQLNNLPEGDYTYTVTTTGGPCASKSETFSLTIVNPTANFVTEPPYGKPGLMVYVNNESQDANTYEWNFGDGNFSTALDTINTYDSIGKYTIRLIASNNGECRDTAYAEVLVYEIEIPNVFTPNGDGVNDVFRVASEGLERIEVEIYNRWGVKIYDWQGPDGYWDGKTTNNKDCSAGTYFYIMRTVDIDGVSYDKNGYITIVR